MFLYHVSPIENRESIFEYGLTGNEGDSLWSRDQPDDYETDQPYGNYFFEFIIPAKEYIYTLFASNLIPSLEADIWQVNVDGLNIMFDPEMNFLDPISTEKFQKIADNETQTKSCLQALCDHPKNDRRWYTPEHVEIHRLQLLTADDQEKIQDHQKVKSICMFADQAGVYPELEKHLSFSI